MKIKKSNIKRLASLSALGAGALGVMGGTAQASTIVYSGILDEKVGFSPGSNLNISFAGPNGAGALLERFSSRVSKHSFEYGVAVGGQNGAKGTQFRFLAGFHSGTFAWGLPGGAKFGSALCGGSACFTTNDAFVALRSAGHNGPGTFHFKAFNPLDRFLLFEFTGGSLPETLYGWAQLEVTFNHNPAVTLVDWAYDTSGAQIPAGDTGSGATPEPATFGLTALAALALGAKGLRAWRAARQAA